jgi:hypothetical protein
VAADARIAARYRGERDEFHSRLDTAGQAIRLAWVSDAFLAQMLYRAKARGQVLGIPVGTGAKVIGPVTIGTGARVGAGTTRSPA